MIREFREMLDDRFGMFIHYGIYSAFEGFYHGRAVKEGTGLGEWIMRNAEIPIAEYAEMGKREFCPAPDFADKIVAAAKEAGMKYIVLTSKHHDGFCLFKSDVSDYNSYTYTGRDLCREMADACRRAGLKIGFYYSHTLDWYEKDAGGLRYSEGGREAHNNNFWDFPDHKPDFSKYLREKCFPQVKELLTRYGDLCLIWFDFPHDITREQSYELRALVKSIQPHCLINYRIAHSAYDYCSLGDNVLPTAPTGIPMECLVTMNNTWGYRRDDDCWKTPEKLIGVLSGTLACDSTLLLNIGPKKDGSMTEETVNILRQMGEWTKRNAPAVYGDITGNPFPYMFPFGHVSRRGNDLYLYVTAEGTERVTLPGLESLPESAEVLGVGKADFFREGNCLKVLLPKTDLPVPVCVLHFSSPPMISEEINEADGEISLGIFWAIKENAVKREPARRMHFDCDLFAPDYGKTGLEISRNSAAHFWGDINDALSWKFTVTKAGVYEAEVLHIPTRGNTSDLYLTLGRQENKVDLENEKYRFSLSGEHAENLRVANAAGEFRIPAPGEYRIFLRRSGDTSGDFPFTEVRLHRKAD